MLEQALQLTKARLGISTDVRDTYLKAIIEGIEADLKKRVGIDLNLKDQGHLMFVVDLATFRYENREMDILPNHLRLRLHNLILSSDKDV